MNTIQKNIIDVSVLIVNYMTYKKTINAIESILAFTENISYEVILLDNASPNGDGEKLQEYCKKQEKVTFIKTEKNIGFAKGNNIALQNAKGEYILFLNSDTVLTTNSLYNGKKYFDENRGIGALSAKLIDVHGNLDNGCMRGFPTPQNSFYYFLRLDRLMKNKEKYGGYQMSYLSPDAINEVDVISGAFFMVKKTLLGEIGSFDESFFMYGEDIDLCFRIREKGKKIIYNPNLGDVIHYKGASGKKRKWKTLFYFYNSMIIFYKKNYQKKYNFAVAICVYIGISIMFCRALVVNLVRRG